MSHLSTLIKRVLDTPQDDKHFYERVLNLREYVENWDDYTEQELVEAYILYSVYRGYLPDDKNTDMEIEGHKEAIIRDGVDNHLS